MRNTIFILLLILSLFFLACENEVEDKYLSQKEIYAYLEQAPFTSPSQNHPIPFGEIDFDKVIAYDFEGNFEPYPAIYQKTSQNFVPVVLRQNFLSQKQVDHTISFLSDPASYGESTAACFDPHMAIVFFKGEEVVFQINICLDCNYLIATEEIPATHAKKIKVDEDLEYPARGFSKLGVARIIHLAKELKLDYGSISLEEE